MHPVLRKFVYLALTFLVLLVALQPYNRFCNFSGKCSAIYLSDLLPTTEGGTQILVVMEAMNYRSDLDFEVFEPRTLNTVSGKKNTVTYRVKNLSDHEIKFRPEFYVEPKEFEKYVSRQECLCFREHLIKKGEELILPTTFKLKSEIDADPIFKETDAQFRIGYKLTPAAHRGH